MAEALLQTMWPNYRTVYGVTFLGSEHNGNLENSENIQSSQSAVTDGGGAEVGERLGKEHYAN